MIWPWSEIRKWEETCLIRKWEETCLIRKWEETCLEQRETIARREEELEAYACKISPSMDQAKLDENAALIERQAKELERLRERDKVATWYETLVTRAKIGTTETPSLQTYIEQLEARLSEGNP